MTTSEFIDELLALDRARFPLLYVVTSEETRALVTLKQVAHLREKAFYTWTFTDGWVDHEGRPALRDHAEQAPLAAVSQVHEAAADRGPEALYILQDLDPFLDDPAVVRRLRDCAALLPQAGHTAVLLSPRLVLPPHLAAALHVLDFPLPDRDTLQQMVDGSVRLIRQDIMADGDPDPTPAGELRAEIVRALSGLTLDEAENIVAKSLVARRRLDPELIVREKQQAIRKTEVLEVITPTEGLDQVGGHECLKEWLREAQLSFSDDARSFGVEPVKGALLVGVPGTAKSLIVKALAHEWHLPLVRVDVGRLMGSLVGESLHGDEEVYFSTSNGTRVQRMTIREAYEKGQRGYTMSYTTDGGFTWAKVIDVVRHKRQERFLHVTTKRGYEVVVTEGHSLFTKSWGPRVFPCPRRLAGNKLVPVRADQLRPSDIIAISRQTRAPKYPTSVVIKGSLSIRVSKHIAELIGLWLGDGSLNHDSLRISTNRNESEVHESLKALGAPLTVYTKPSSYAHRTGVDVTINDFTLAATFRMLEVSDTRQTARRKRVPAWVFGMSNEIVSAVLRGYFSADGCFSGHNIEVSSRSKNLIYDIAGLLRRFAIVPAITKKYEADAWTYRLSISRATEQIAFLKRIGFLQTTKNAALDVYLRRVMVMRKRRRAAYAGSMPSGFSTFRRRRKRNRSGRSISGSADAIPGISTSSGSPMAAPGTQVPRSKRPSSTRSVVPFSTRGAT